MLSRYAFAYGFPVRNTFEIISSALLCGSYVCPVRSANRQFQLQMTINIHKLSCETAATYEYIFSVRHLFACALMYCPYSAYVCVVACNRSNRIPFHSHKLAYYPTVARIAITKRRAPTESIILKIPTHFCFRKCRWLKFKSFALHVVSKSETALDTFRAHSFEISYAIRSSSTLTRHSPQIKQQTTHD